MLTALRGFDLDRSLAVVRIFLAAAALLNAHEAHDQMMGIASGAIRVPVPGIDLPMSPLWVWTLTGAGVVLALLLGLGAWTTPAALGSAAVSALVLLTDQQTFSNHRHLVTVLLLLLAFTASDRAWAARPRRAHAPAHAPAHRPWVVLMMLTQLSVLYLFAGLVKVHTAFLSGVPLGLWIRVDLPQPLLVSMAIGTVVGELFLAVGFWFARTRVLACVIGVMLHGSIVVLMNEGTLQLVAFTFACVPLYALHFQRAELAREAAARAPAQEPTSTPVH